MGSGLNYVLRLLKGESLKSVLKDMPDEDYAQIQAVAANFKLTGLNRQQRRKMERKIKTIKR